MNTYIAILLCLAVVSASASHIGYGIIGHNHEAHISSGSVAIGHNGVVIAGPSGSVKTDNGLHGHGAGAKISGPSGIVATHGGHAHLAGPGIEHHEHGIIAAASAIHAAPIVAASLARYTVVAGPISHATIVGPTAHTSIVAPVHHVSHEAAPLQGHHAAIVAAPTWGHHGVITHGHQGW